MPYRLGYGEYGDPGIEARERFLLVLGRIGTDLIADLRDKLLPTFSALTANSQEALSSLPMKLRNIAEYPAGTVEFVRYIDEASEFIEQFWLWAESKRLGKSRWVWGQDNFVAWAAIHLNAKLDDKLKMVWIHWNVTDRLLADEREYEFIFGYTVTSLQRSTREQKEKEIREHFERQLKYFFDDLEAQEQATGQERTPELTRGKWAFREYEWLIRYHIQGETFYGIAKADGADRNTIRPAVKLCAQRVGLVIDLD